MSDDVTIPPEFFKTLSDKEIDQIVVSNGVLDRGLCRRLWRMQGRTDKPPHKLMLMFNREDILREFPPR